MEQPIGAPLKKYPVLYVSNIDYATTADRLEDLFIEKGVEPINIEFLKKGKKGWTKPCGLATVHLKDDEAVAKAMAELQAAELDGREISVSTTSFS